MFRLLHRHHLLKLHWHQPVLTAAIHSITTTTTIIIIIIIIISMARTDTSALESCMGTGTTVLPR